MPAPIENQNIGFRNFKSGRGRYSAQRQREKFACAIDKFNNQNCSPCQKVENDVARNEPVSCSRGMTLCLKDYNVPTRSPVTHRKI